MDKKFEAQLLKNAIKIGEEIIDKAIIDSNGIHWRTVKAISPYWEIELTTDETIATGVSGIVLFYIELYKATRSEIYLEYINSSANWLINYCPKNKPTHGYYAGRMGVVFTLLKVADITQKEDYRDKAIEIASAFKDIQSEPILSFNLYSGLAGTVLGFLHLYAEVKESWILDAIYQNVETLVRNIKSDETGFYWNTNFFDSTAISTKPVCSLPLGGGGIALVFMYLSKYFNNKDYEYIATQALRYEDQYYNQELNNWIDHRIVLDQKKFEKLKRSYLKGDYSSFETSTYNFNWMYGLIGNYFVRSCAHNIFDDAYPENILNQIEHKLSSLDIGCEFDNHTLATGTSGVGLSLLNLSLTKNNKGFYDSALAIAQKSIDNRNRESFYQFGFSSETKFEDDSLLMGNAGIGYFYLKLLSGETDDVLLPGINTTANITSGHQLFQFNINNAIDKIAREWYPNTFSVIGDNSIIEKWDLNPDSMKESLVLSIESLIANKQDVKVKDAYAFDTKKLKIQQLIQSNFSIFRLSAIIGSTNRNILEHFSRERLMDLTLKLNKFSHFHTSRWDWKTNLLDEKKDNKQQVNILFAAGEEYNLSEIQYSVLNSFQTPQKVKNLYKIFLQSNESMAQDTEYALHLYLDIIKYFMHLGALITVKQHLFSLQFSTSKSNPLASMDNFSTV